MAKKKGNVYGAVVLYEKTYKGTSIGRRPNTSSMNKNKRRSFKKYKGQGRWIIKDQCSIQMESLFHIKCHRILDLRKAKEVVGVVDSIQDLTVFVAFIELKVSEILMFATNGDKDILKDNGRACSLFNFTIALIWWADD